MIDRTEVLTLLDENVLLVWLHFRGRCDQSYASKYLKVGLVLDEERIPWCRFALGALTDGRGGKCKVMFSEVNCIPFRLVPSARLWCFLVKVQVCMRQGNLNDKVTFLQVQGQISIFVARRADYLFKKMRLQMTIFVFYNCYSNWNLCMTECKSADISVMVSAH